jgi:EAL domain-containing protein (putative c-di-GMP-specific phosphodiesterase class I)
MQMGSDASSAAIVMAVADMGNRLGISTIAEGVETTQQLEAVQACGFTATQGYLFSRPLSAEDLKVAMAVWETENVFVTQSKAAA